MNALDKLQNKYGNECPEEFSAIRAELARLQRIENAAKKVYSRSAPKHPSTRPEVQDAINAWRELADALNK